MPPVTCDPRERKPLGKRCNDTYQRTLSRHDVNYDLARISVTYADDGPNSCRRDILSLSKRLVGFAFRLSRRLPSPFALSFSSNPVA